MIGWWSLLLFLTVGIVLEALHGFKVAWYLNVGMETRRLMWRLAHAHGTFLALIHIAFAMTLSCLTSPSDSGETPEPAAKAQSKKRKKPAKKPTESTSTTWEAWASRCLIGAIVGLPGGFFLGGVVVRGGDPGVGIIVLPIGAGLLMIAVFLIAKAVSAR